MTLTAPLAPSMPARVAPSQGSTVGLLRKQDLRLLAILARGIPLGQIASISDVSDRTIRRRIRRICDVLEVRTPIEAVAWAARRRLI